MDGDAGAGEKREPPAVGAEAKATPAAKSSDPPLAAATPEREKLSLLDRSRIMRDVVTVVALSIAGIWALVTFWYNSQYLPAHEAPIVTPTMTINVLGEKDGKVALNAHLVLHNEGKATQTTWAISFYAVGQKVTFEPPADGGVRDVKLGEHRYTSLRDFHVDAPQLLAANVDLMTERGRSNPILPRSELHWDFEFYADKATVDTVTVIYDVIHPGRDVPPKPEWLKLEAEDNHYKVVATPECAKDPSCTPVHIQAHKAASLWR